MSVTERFVAVLLWALALVITWGSPEGVLAQEQALSTIWTVAADSRDGLSSRITLIRPDETRIRLGASSSSDGQLKLNNPEQCRAGMVLEARPRSAWYKRASKDVECANPEVVELQPVNFGPVSAQASSLVANLENVVVGENDPALEALLLNDLAAEVEDEDSTLYNDYAQRAVYAVADATDFNGEPVGPGGGTILAPEFGAYLEERQRSQGLEPTGVLDYETLATEADHDVFWFRYDVFALPASVPTRSEPIQCMRLTPEDVLDGGESPLVTALIRLAEERESVGQYGNAALLFNEALARNSDDTMIGLYVEQRVYENVGRALSVSNPIWCDPIQGRFVMTPELVDSVRARQQEQATGILDYLTIRGLADIDVGPFLGRQPERQH